MWLIVHPYTKYVLFVKEAVGMPVQNVAVTLETSMNISFWILK